MRKLGQKIVIFFLKCILKKIKATKKQLKRSKSKKSKESEFDMLDSPCRLLFYVFKCRKISTGLNE